MENRYLWLAGIKLWKMRGFDSNNILASWDGCCRIMISWAMSLVGRDEK